MQMLIAYFQHMKIHLLYNFQMIIIKDQKLRIILQVVYYFDFFIMKEVILRLN